MLVQYSGLGCKRSAGKLGGTGYMSALYWDLGWNNHVCQKTETYLSCLLCAGTWGVVVNKSARKLGDVPIMSALYSNLGDCKCLALIVMLFGITINAKQHYN